MIIIPDGGLQMYIDGVSVGNIMGLHYNVPLGDQRPALVYDWNVDVTVQITDIEWNEGLIRKLMKPLVDLPIHELPPSRFLLWLSTFRR